MPMIFRPYTRIWNCYMMHCKRNKLTQNKLMRSRAKRSIRWINLTMMTWDDMRVANSNAAATICLLEKELLLHMGFLGRGQVG